MGDVEKYGQFIEDGRCFELTAEPPKKWFNVHYNQPGDDEFYAEVSQLGDGAVRARDKAGNTVNLFAWDDTYLYIRDDETNTVFNPGGAPVVADMTDYSCRFYPEKTVITGTCDDLHAEQRVFVPRDETAMVWTLNLKNLSDRPRKISLFTYARFALNGCNSEGQGTPSEPFAYIMPELGGVYAENKARKVPPTDRFKAFVITLNELRNANAHRMEFTRQDYSLSTPNIQRGWNCDGQGGRFGGDNAGILQISFELAPGATERADFILGQTDSPESVQALRERMTPETIDAACAEQERISREQSDAFTVSTGNKNYDALINHFAKKAMVSYIIDKSGFRDNVQIDSALALFDYEMAKTNFLQALSSQYPTGSVPHSFRPMNRLQYSDKPAWIFLTAPLLIKESGDFSMLDIELPYFECDEKGTVWDHMIRAMRFLCNDTGANGLCDQHFADWNDGLEPSDKTGARESIMVTQQLCYGLLEMEELAKWRGDANIEKEAREQYDLFKKRLNEIAWDGEWYIRSTCEVGTPLGTSKDDQAQIFQNTQSWAVLSQTAEGDRVERCMKSVDKHIELDIGFLISAPPCTRYDERIGKYSAILPGHGTNGGAYCHAAGFKAVADCMIGRAEEAWRTFVKTAPDSPWNPISVSKIEPFSFTNCYEAVESQYGEGIYAWRTGTTGWFTMALIEWMFGVRRTYEGLIIDPCLSKELPKVSLTRKFRGATYEIEIDNTAGRCTGTTSITVDGEPLEGNLLPVFDGGTHTICAVI